MKFGFFFFAVATSMLVSTLACSNAPREKLQLDASPIDASPVDASSPVGAASPDASSTIEASAKPTGPRLVALGYEPIKTHRRKRFAWRQITEVNWQPIADELPPLVPEPALDSKSCPPGMVPIEGNYLLDERGRDDTDGVLAAQNSVCTFWRTNGDHGVNGLCDKFDPEKWKLVSEKLPRKQMRFCIDRYEYPNSYGEFPLVVTTFSESAAYCKKEQKRLCSESEWTFACEGEEGRPYPYGFERDTAACTIGILAAGPDKDTFRPRTLPHTASGLDFAWHGKRSGESPNCKSPFGVFDMTGNVDEWTVNVRRYGYKMIMKGGHWGPARQRCRPQTRGHGPMYVRYDQGFRCCADPDESERDRAP